MASETATTPLQEVLAALPLPSLDDLTDRQVRGITCVWDAALLGPAIAVDLGERTTKRAGDEVRWFPRACRRCIGVAALEVLHEHAPMCEPCVDNAEECPTGRALNRLIREGRRG